MKNKFYIPTFRCSLMILLISRVLLAQQAVDIDFNPDVNDPAYSEGNGPVVLIDGAHNNFHTVTGRYRPFADILRKDGYVVNGLKSNFTSDILQKTDIVVISNALNAVNVDKWMLPTPSAFTESEIEIIQNWVLNGGSLLLIADHMPFPGAIEELAQNFGFLIGNGFAFVDYITGLIKFRSDDGSLLNHPIVKGRKESETVEYVTTFTGQAFRLAPDCMAEPLMVLGKGSTLLLPVESWSFPQRTPHIIAEGMLQGATINYGAGRVAMFGEAAMFTAQVSGSEPMGMSHPEAQYNMQFMLNVLHWLSGLLSDELPVSFLIADFNGDGVVDIDDLLILVEYWGTDEPLCDIAPLPDGDGIVDELDLALLMEFWLQEEIPEPGLITHWKLDETEGDIAYDSIGDNHGILSGNPAWQPDSGQIAGALEFDGVDDYVSTPFVLNPADGKFSVFVWIKGGAPDQVVISQTDGADWLSADPSAGNLMTELKGPGQSPGPLISQTVITDGEWHRIGFVWDGSQRMLYVDDVEVARDTQSGLEGSVEGLYIGTGKTLEAKTFWSGLIDDIRIYDRAAMPQGIAAPGKTARR